MKQFSIERTAAGRLRLRLLEDGEEMGGGSAPDTEEDRWALENEAYSWGATEEVDAGGADAKPTR
jgi:hypothetical protein